MQNARAKFCEIDIKHHDDEKEEHRHGADINDQQDHSEEFSARQQEETSSVEEGQNQEQNRVNRVPCRNDHECRRDRDEGEYIKEYSLQTHVGAFLS
ncbi:hypothetical protein D3C80_1836370 [compost metagenome]